jgi:hypothetical protein
MFAVALAFGHFLALQVSAPPSNTGCNPCVDGPEMFQQHGLEKEPLSMTPVASAALEGMKAAIECNLTPTGVRVRMAVPHPKHALVYRPDGVVVYLQGSPEYLHRQVESFHLISEWKIDREMVGTTYDEGAPRLMPVIAASGEYRLYIADNLETEPDNASFLECYFEIPARLPN